MSLRLLLCLALALAAPGAGRVAGGVTPPPLTPSLPPGPFDRLDTWIAAVEAHKAGDLDEPARQVAAWPRPVLDDLFRYQQALLTLMARPSDADRAALVRNLGKAEVGRLVRFAGAHRLAANSQRFIKRAVLLHTDIAILSPDSGNSLETAPARPSRAGAGEAARATRLPEAPPPGALPRRLAGTALDGQEFGTEFTGAHWDIARAIVDRASPRAAADADLRLWYRATVAFLSANYALVDLAPQVFHAQLSMPSDAAVDFAIGCLYETYASPRLRTVADARTGNRSSPFGIPPVWRSLQQGEIWFREALKADPTLVEAHVRLGHLASLRGRHAEARTEILQAVSSTDPDVEYFARLLLGAEDETLGDFARAGESYRRAAELFPLAQSPQLALSQLAERQGRRRDALAGAGRLFAMGPDERARLDPWWAYYQGDGRHADTLIGQMRDALAKAR
jgi:hypothetical protein